MQVRNVTLTLILLLIPILGYSNEKMFILSNMFYENYFWVERKLTEQEKKQADLFIEALMEEAETGIGHAMNHYINTSETENYNKYSSAMMCDKISVLSTALSLYRSQSKYYPEYRNRQVEIENLFNTINSKPSTPTLPNVKRCKQLNYWMPNVDLFEE